MAARAGREGEDRAAIRLGDASGQALILAIGGAIALLAGALALVAISGAVTGKGRVQRAADLVAISAARSMRDDLPRLLSPPTLADGLPNPAHIDKLLYLARARAAAVQAARANGFDAPGVRVSFPDLDSFAPVRAKAILIARLRGGGGVRVEASATAEAAAVPAGIAGARCVPTQTVGANREPRGAALRCRPVRPSV